MMIPERLFRQGGRKKGKPKICQGQV